MAKKKKSQLKPVVRGFATTSVPKKAVAAEADVLPTDVFAVDPECSPSSDGAQDASGDSVVPSHVESDQDKAQEATLQNLVERLQEKTEKEITRTIKVGPFDVTFPLRCPDIFARQSRWRGVSLLHFLDWTWMILGSIGPLTS
jgi:ATP-dependent RNA helicase DHX29